MFDRSSPTDSEDSCPDDFNNNSLLFNLKNTHLPSDLNITVIETEAESSPLNTNINNCHECNLHPPLAPAIVATSQNSNYSSSYSFIKNELDKLRNPSTPKASKKGAKKNIATLHEYKRKGEISAESYKNYNILLFKMKKIA